MPHISKQFLEKKKFQDIHSQLFKVINMLVREGKTTAILNELFTKTEKLMLAKRLAIIFMLDQKESSYAISNILKVSQSTVALMSLKQENGKYSDIIKEMRKQNNFWIQLQKIIPPRVGRNRFKNFLQF
ncbi:MAG: Trp family transcriptional regulator [Candidatus Paceibacterota bacterium]|jgi:uncharacterized protein YerC